MKGLNYYGKHFLVGWELLPPCSVMVHTTGDSPDDCWVGTGCHRLLRDATSRTSSPSNRTEMLFSHLTLPNFLTGRDTTRMCLHSSFCCSLINTSIWTTWGKLEGSSGLAHLKQINQSVVLCFCWSLSSVALLCRASISWCPFLNGQPVQIWWGRCSRNLNLSSLYYVLVDKW